MTQTGDAAEAFPQLLQTYADSLETLRPGWVAFLAAVADIPPLPPEAERLHLASTFEEDYLLPAQSVVVFGPEGRSVTLDPDQKARLKRACDAVWAATPRAFLEQSYALRAAVFRQQSQNAALHTLYGDVIFPFIQSCLPDGAFAHMDVAVTCGLFDFEGEMLKITLHDPAAPA